MHQKKQVIGDHEISYSSDWIHRIETLDHWVYYWHQASLIWAHVAKSSTILEVGVGTSFISNYVKSKGWKCITLDLDKEKEPDIVGEISSADLSALNFDCVTAFEIFEHLPYPLFERAVENIARARPRYILFSVPWSERRLFELSLKVPKVRLISTSARIKKRRITTPNHFWELKKRGSANSEVLLHGKRGLIPEREIKKMLYGNGYNLSNGPRVRHIQFFVAEAM